MEEVIDPKTGLKSKKRVIKKDAVGKLLAQHKFKGSKKFMYFDLEGNLVILD